MHIRLFLSVTLLLSASLYCNEEKEELLKGMAYGLSWSSVDFAIIKNLKTGTFNNPKEASIALQYVSALDSIDIQPEQRISHIKLCLAHGAKPCLDAYGNLLGRSATLRHPVDAQKVELAEQILKHLDAEQAKEEYAMKRNKFIVGTSALDTLFDYSK